MKARHIFITFCIIANVLSYIYLKYNPEDSPLGLITTTIVVFSIVFHPVLIMIAMVEPEKKSFKNKN